MLNIQFNAHINSKSILKNTKEKYYDGMAEGENNHGS